MNANSLPSGIHSRTRRRRNLDILFSAASVLTDNITMKAGAASEPKAMIPDEFTPHQYVIFLLHVAAELEHVLMVQYLYAGYSLGGSNVPQEHQKQVQQWREVILGIAKEEMGHLMTIQNVLRCLGGPLNFDREDFPWDSEFYPFPFMLEPLSLKSLAKYIVAESPADWSGEEADHIRNLALDAIGGSPLHRVGELFKTIETLLNDGTKLKDHHFRESAYPFQATWDEWGRGYQGGSRGNSVGGAIPGTPDVLLFAVTCRTDTLAALSAIATQGEATQDSSDLAPSHFARFLHIFRTMPKDSSWSPTRNVATNPVVVPEGSEWPGTPITNPVSKDWAHLFNLRYRLLLTNLAHAFEYPNNVSDQGQKTPRGFLNHATFGEMYNLRVLSEILFQSPVGAKAPGQFAGPPFQMPFTLKFPIDEAGRWQQHLDLVEASAVLTASLRDKTDAKSVVYLDLLDNIDRETAGSIRAILK